MRVKEILSLSPALWLDASDLGSMQTDALNVAAIRDKSAIGNRATQTTDSLQPQLMLDAIDGKSVIVSYNGGYFEIDRGVAIKVFYTVTIKPSSPVVARLEKFTYKDTTVPITIIHANFAEMIGFSAELSEEHDAFIKKCISNKWALGSKWNDSKRR